MSHPNAAFHRRIPALLSVAVAVALVSSACASTTPATSSAPTPAPSASPTAPASAAPAGSPVGSPSAGADAAADAVYDTVETQVQAIRGLQATRPVARQLITADELRTILTTEFDQETPPASLAANERLYKALGLIPADSSLRTLSLDLLSSGVAAFYRDDEGKLYVVSKTGEPGPTERFYFSHEFDHALQDQNSTIFKDFHDVHDQSDELLARQAIYEGDATLLMTQWAAANLTPADLGALLAAGNDPVAQAVMARTPPILSQTLQFPYTTGFAYVTNVQSNGGWPAVNAYFSKMPRSTEQILHPEKYTSGEAPVAVTMPSDLASRLGDGWSVPLQDTFGELQLGIWLRGAGVANADATKAAAGWGGDRLAVMDGPNDAWGVAIQTVWDTDADAVEFEAAAKTALEKAGGSAQVLPGAGGKTRWVVVASDPAVLGHVANALGLGG
ncbi:MAG TPA: hypothetical protein VGQ31_00525 [Candidatus Limnocylindrales bacterium]|nr:hypothetical protein [Candidatus Limnocylindrales bacterium]